MQISPVSTVNSSYAPASTPAPKPTSQTPTDTVQLSPAAQARVSGGDVDHDGDSH